MIYQICKLVFRRSGLPYTHLASPKPYKFKGLVPRGVSNRRAALQWLRENARKGVLYFGDDDNSIDLRLFDEIRRTKKVSMFPVGLIGSYGISSPVVKNGKVSGRVKNMLCCVRSAEFIIFNPRGPTPTQAGCGACSTALTNGHIIF